MTAEPAIQPVDTLSAYLDRVHLIADDSAWQSLKAELLTLANTAEAEAIAAWLAERRVVFPGFEDEVAAKVVALRSIEPPAQTDKPAVVPVRPARPRPVTPMPMVIPRLEPAGAARQLALF